MESGLLISVGLPMALAIIMFGLGLHLTVDDFRRVLIDKKPIIIGLMCQMVLTPIICFGIAKTFGLTPALAVGLMLLAASPGGVTANMYSYLFKGDVALNISLTAINSLITVITIPLIVNFALAQFMTSGEVIPMQFKKVLEVIFIVCVPVLFGVIANHRWPYWAKRTEKVVRVLSVLLLVLMIISIVIKERNNILHYIQLVGPAVLTFNIASMFIGYFVPQIFSINRPQRIAISMEIGIHNTALAIYLAITVLKNTEMSIPAAIYTLVSYIVAIFFGFMVSRMR